MAQENVELVRRLTEAYNRRDLDARLDQFVDDPVEVAEDLLIAENVAYMRGRDGIEVEARSAWLITVRNGEQTSLTLFQTKREALEAAGLAD